MANNPYLMVRTRSEYIQYYKKMVGQTQRPWVRQNPTSCLTQCKTEKKFSSTLRNICKKQHGARPINSKKVSRYFELICVIDPAIS
jgi:hypothetical protein